MPSKSRTLKAMRMLAMRMLAMRTLAMRTFAMRTLASTHAESFTTSLNNNSCSFLRRETHQQAHADILAA